VGAIGVKQILGQMGALNALFVGMGWMDAGHPVDWLGAGRLPGVIVMNSLHLYPILYLNITAALSNLDPAMDEAAENLGCAPVRRFFRVTLPLAMPGIFAGASIVFIWGFTELGVPLIFDYSRVTSVQIFDGAKDMGGNPLPYALVAVMLVISVLLFLASKLAFGRSDYASAGRASMAAQMKVLRGWKGMAAAGLAAKEREREELQAAYKEAQEREKKHAAHKAAADKKKQEDAEKRAAKKRAKAEALAAPPAAAKAGGGGAGGVGAAATKASAAAAAAAAAEAAAEAAAPLPARAPPDLLEKVNLSHSWYGKLSEAECRALALAAKIPFATRWSTEELKLELLRHEKVSAFACCTWVVNPAPL
jgi:hypothetical protein